MKNVMCISNYINDWINPKGLKRIIIILLILSLELLVGSMVFTTGGTKYAYLHVMYFPIFLGSLTFGYLGGLSFGILGGLIVGPYMPIDVSVMSMQSLHNWLIRTLFFIIIGVLMGIVLNLLMKYIKNMNTIAFYNPITNLYNRKYFENTHLKKEENYFLAILKIENFSKAISNLGYDVSLDILRNFSDKLIEQGQDQIFHFSDDQFAILLNGEGEEEKFKNFSNALRSTIQFDNVEFFPEISLGIAKYNKTNIDLIKEAEMARIVAKNNLLDFYIYIPELLKYNVANFELFNEIPRALKNNEFFLCFQPKVAIGTKKIEGAEVLIRWNHPTKGLISPDNFIPYLETTNFINKITFWLFRESLKELKKFKKLGLDINLSVNIPMKSMQNPVFLDILKNFKDLELPLDQIEIEFLERDLIKDFDSIAKTMNKIKKFGIGFSLDDFGTGYSSISYIKKLPFDKVKIDQMFISDIDKNKQNRDLVKSFIDLAHILDLTVIAEGVESKDAFDILTKLNCDYIQGYYLAKPLKDVDFIEWCKTSSEIDNSFII